MFVVLYICVYICLCMCTKQARPANSFARRWRLSQASTSVVRSASRTRLATRWTNCRRSPKVRRHPMASPWVPGSWRELQAILRAPQTWLVAPVGYPGPQSPTRQPPSLRAPRPARDLLPALLSEALRPARTPSMAQTSQGGLSAPRWTLARVGASAGKY